VLKHNNVKYVPGQGPPMPQQCAETGAGYLMGGPLWAEPLHDPEWLKGLIEILDVRPLLLWS
jgi:tRNA (guanine26-N2/guanine27-N2)-dimethyltransferase